MNGFYALLVYMFITQQLSHHSTATNKWQLPHPYIQMDRYLMNVGTCMFNGTCSVRTLLDKYIYRRQISLSIEMVVTKNTSRVIRRQLLLL